MNRLALVLLAVLAVIPEPPAHTYAHQAWLSGATVVGPCTYDESTSAPVGTVEYQLLGDRFRGSRLCVQGEGATVEQPGQ